MEEYAADLQWLQLLSTALLEAALAIAVGAAALAGASPRLKLRKVTRWSVAALGTALVLEWWAGAAAMTGAVGTALPTAFAQVLTESHFGAMIEVAGVAWLLLAFVAFLPDARQGESTRSGLFVLGLLLFAFARAATGHAMDRGLFSLAVFVHTAHILAGSAWLGTVAVGAWIARDWQVWNAVERAALAQRLSTVATLALAVVVASGLLNIVRMLGGSSQWRDSPYVWLLGAKLAGVALATSLGAYNRWRQLPRLRVSTGRCFGRVLLFETLVLGSVLVAAAQLGSMMPPE